MGVNVAIMSYNGVAYVGFGGDVVAVPDIERLEEMLRESFAELCKAAASVAPSQTDDEKPARKEARSRLIARATTKTGGTKPRMRQIPVAPPARKKTARKPVPFPSGAPAKGVAAEPPPGVFAQAGD